MKMQMTSCVAPLRLGQIFTLHYEVWCMIYIIEYIPFECSSILWERKTLELCMSSGVVLLLGIQVVTRRVTPGWVAPTTMHKSNNNNNISSTKIALPSINNSKHPTIVSRKVALLGHRAVGKSCLTNSFLSGAFSPVYDPTIESTYHKTIRFRKVHFTTDIVDTAGMVCPEKFCRSYVHFIKCSENAHIQHVAKLFGVGRVFPIVA